MRASPNAGTVEVPVCMLLAVAGELGRGVSVRHCSSSCAAAASSDLTFMSVTPVPSHTWRRSFDTQIDLDAQSGRRDGTRGACALSFSSLGRWGGVWADSQPDAADSDTRRSLTQIGADESRVFGPITENAHDHGTVHVGQRRAAAQTHPSASHHSVVQSCRRVCVEGGVGSLNGLRG